MISVDEALELIRANRMPVKHEQIPIESALGRRLAVPARAHVSRPPANMSAMDGYAVRLDDVRNESAHLHVIGQAPAGRPFEGTVTPGTAVRVFTGSVIPAGADHVVIQENAERDGQKLISLQAYDAPRHIRKAGLDFGVGDTLLEPGTVLASEHLAVLAAGNNPSVEVERRPTVGLLANGDELRSPGSILAPGQIVNSNPIGLAGLINKWGGEVIDLGTASDDLNAIKTHISRADVDILVPIGGASVGDHDHMRRAFDEMGFESVFEKIAVRPGKPTWYSRSETTRVLGLPGNPASSLVCAHLFLAPLLGYDLDRVETFGRLSRAIPANGPREHFMRAKASINHRGQVEIEPALDQDSSLLTPFLSSNALIRREPGASPQGVGDIVPLKLIGSLVEGP